MAQSGGYRLTYKEGTGGSVSTAIKALAVGVDIGGSKVLAGVVDHRGQVLACLRADTPAPSELTPAIETVVVRLVDELRTSYDVQCVGVAAAGFVKADGVVAFAPHLSWRGEPLQSALEERLELPVAVDNDANAAAVGEMSFGGARGSRDFVCLTLGTGIGGAIVLDGNVRRGSKGFAGEFGHWPMEQDGRPCPCGLRGCWEQYCSGTALIRAVAQQGGGLWGLSGRDITEAAESGAPWAAAAFDEVGSWLGHGLAGVCAALDPELVVVGGGLAEAGDLLLEPARAVLGRRLVGADYRAVPPVHRAELGELAGMIGAAEIARSGPVERLDRSPR